MKRIQHFISNLTLLAILQCLAIGIILIFALRRDIGSGLWLFTVPILVGCFAVSYPFRHYLLEHLVITWRVMNSIAVIALVGYFLFRKSGDVESDPFRIGMSAFIGLYMGFYFWVLSDWRIERQR